MFPVKHPPTAPHHVHSLQIPRGANPASPCLRLDGVSKSNGVHTVLEGASICFQGACIHGLTGPAGSGKTALLRGIVGIERFDTGTASLDGHRLHLLGAREALAAGIGYLSSDLPLRLGAGVAENIMCDRMILDADGGVNWPASCARASLHMESLGISIDPELPVRCLDQAQRLCVHIARALAAEVRVLLFDDVLRLLGPETRDRLLQLLCELRAQGLLIVLSSSTLDDSFCICDHLTMLKAGRLVSTTAMHVVGACDSCPSRSSRV